MTISCTITRNGRSDEYGRPLTISQAYTGANDFVKSLVQTGYASVPDMAVFDDDSTHAGSQIEIIPDGSFGVLQNVDPVSGVVRNSAGGKTTLPIGPNNRRRTNVMPCSNMAISAATTITRHGAYILRGARWAAYKARIHNGHTAAVTYSCAVYTSDAIGDGVYSDKTWDKPTFSGASSVSVPAATGLLPQHVSGVVDSDIVYNPSAVYDGGTILALRSYCAVANNTRFNPPGGVVGDVLSTKQFRSCYQIIDGITDITAFNTPINVDALPPVSLVAYTDAQMRRIGLFGGSTIAGTADGLKLGWAWQAQYAMTTDSVCYQFVNEGQPSSKTSVSLSRFVAALARGDRYDMACYGPFSTNDSTDSDYGTDAYIYRLNGQVMVFLDFCFEYGIEPVLTTFQYPTGMTGTAYAQAKEINAYVRQIAANGICRLFDIAAIFSDESAVTGAWIDGTDTTDGIHPDSSGTAKVVQVAQIVFS